MRKHFDIQEHSPIIFLQTSNILYNLMNSKRKRSFKMLSDLYINIPLSSLVLLLTQLQSFVLETKLILAVSYYYWYCRGTQLVLRSPSTWLRWWLPVVNAVFENNFKVFSKLLKLLSVSKCSFKGFTNSTKYESSQLRI